MTIGTVQLKLTVKKKTQKLSLSEPPQVKAMEGIEDEDRREKADEEVDMDADKGFNYDSLLQSLKYHSRGIRFEKYSQPFEIRFYYDDCLTLISHYV
jgi:hypothetical protein